MHLGLRPDLKARRSFLDLVRERNNSFSDSEESLRQRPSSSQSFRRTTAFSTSPFGTGSATAASQPTPPLPLRSPSISDSSSDCEYPKCPCNRATHPWTAAWNLSRSQSTCTTSSSPPAAKASKGLLRLVHPRSHKPLTAQAADDELPLPGPNSRPPTPTPIHHSASTSTSSSPLSPPRPLSPSSESYTSSAHDPQRNSSSHPPIMSPSVRLLHCIMAICVCHVNRRHHAHPAGTP